ncbi:HAMP domain-containing sensor histidine kinase [Halobacillus litoralis]|uniref:HAMP domain-containing sensor histidine kinase n=1 Tax=Halobacillus litoralis TaxID=45668 RepID=UPI00273F46A9|nr:HAMP domain-containing sensor histidine kinase [Halobacillus litoralis]WLR47178.1 HAMP domain-containing sensor histidine kinase [Halobacillus litoralis]
MRSKLYVDWGISGVFKQKKRKNIFYYWSRRYLTTLLVGLVIIAVLSVVWIRQTTVDNRLNLMHIVAQEIADRVVSTNGRILAGPLFEEILRKRSEELQVNEPPTGIVVSAEGEILITNNRERTFKNRGDYLEESLYKTNESTITLEGNEKAYVVSEPIKSDSETLGYIVLVNEKSVLSSINHEYRLLAAMLGGVGLLGWAVIYYMTKKVSKPLKETATAAKQVSEGNYDINLTDIPKERELAELMGSFSEMADKLKRLEDMRNELLAGVTHDLKTPVTSMSGLIQAVKDEIVDGEEAKEYLDLSLKEMERLQTMIQDLLSFNTYVSGSFPIQKKHQDLHLILRDFEKQWRSDPSHTPLRMECPAEAMKMKVDDHRVKQILLNVVQNADHAVKDNDGSITLAVHHSNDYVDIDVSDTGDGIPSEEQGLIFERFYRGEAKKLKERGLGLGLPLSRMLARALGGDLLLRHSSGSGTTFTLRLPKE